MIVTAKEVREAGARQNFREAKCCANCLGCKGESMNSLYCEIEDGVIIGVESYNVCDKFR